MCAAMSAVVTALEAAAGRKPYRWRTRLAWMDNILGGGFVCGSVVLVHGGPGAGKSTALAQAAAGVPESLYVTLEEDVALVADRVLRLGLRPDMALLAESDVAVAMGMAGLAPLVILDSIQMTDGGALDAVRVAVAHARSRQVAVVLVCHETKAGQHAGVRTIEHLVDVTLKFGREPVRYIACEKNRYGPAGIHLPLEMTPRGFVCNAP